MLQAIFYLFVSFVFIYLLIALFKKLVPVVVLILGMVFLIIFGVPYLLGVVVEKACRLIKLRFLTSILVAIFSVVFFGLFAIAGFSQGLEHLNFDLIKYTIPACVFSAPLYFHYHRMRAQSLSEVVDVFDKETNQFYEFYFTAFFIFIVSLFTPDFMKLIDTSKQMSIYASWFYWGFGVLVLIGLMALERSRKLLLERVFNSITSENKINSTALLKSLVKEFSLPEIEVEAIFDGVSTKFIENDEIEEITLNGNIWFFKSSWFAEKNLELNNSLSAQIRCTSDHVDKEVIRVFQLPELESKEFRYGHLACGEMYNFIDADFFVTYRNSTFIKSCVCCGCTIETNDSEDVGEWYCSDICKETESICLDIKNKPIEVFLSDAATSGFVVMAGASAWSQNQQIFAMASEQVKDVNGELVFDSMGNKVMENVTTKTGHGFAAENANTKIDKLMGKDAKVIGGDNAKHGADRSVNGQQIQTKYCSTGRQSVNAGFGKDGIYKYYDGDKPMLLEVPKDQYEKAVETMARKIEEGKVPGIDDPAEAKNLITKGNITYSQAQNITKFGTFESISYDISEGVIVGAVAGGISFGVSALIFYINTKDPKEALRIGVIQGGKAFGKSMTVYVAAQQLHRVVAVQKLLGGIDVSSPTLARALSKGMGVSKSQVNNALKGTIVTSVAVIAVTTGPELIKLIRGRISQAQFFKNLAVVSSSVVGGTVGSVAGGIAFAPLGPVGVMAGRLAGGMVGGMAFAAVANKVGNSLIEEDRVKMLKVIKSQMEYLAITFMLTAEEMDNLNKNLDKVLEQKSLEILFAAKNKIAMSNFFLKPVVVSVVKQRPTLNYSAENLIEVCEELAA